MPTPRDPDAPAPPEQGLPTPLGETSPPHDALLLPAVHQLIQPYITAAAAHGPIPPLRSDAWLDAHPDQQIAHLLIAGMAATLASPQTTIRAVLRQTGHQVHGGDDTFWRRAGNLHTRNVANRDQRERDRIVAEARAIVAEDDSRQAP